MLQALRAQDALAIAEVSRRRSRDEQAMPQYLVIGRGSEEWRRLEAAIAQLSPDARRELAPDRVDGGRR
jgi:hypothetical protein